MIGAAALAVGALCAGARYRGGYVFLIRHETLQLFPDGTDLVQKSVKLLSAAFALTGGTLLLGMTHRCLRAEQAEGTPFTVRGAERIRTLGVRFIYIPVITDAVSGAAAVWLGGTKEMTGCFGGITTGVVLLILSLMIRCGAEMAGECPKQAAE